MHLHIMQAQFMPAESIIEDAMTAPRRDDALVDAWRELLDSHARTHSALEHALKEHDLGVSEFEVLERLMGDSAEQRRMQELGKAVHLSQSALSRVVARLEKDGLVERGLCPEDRRGIFVCITDAGRDRYEAARPAHRAALADAMWAGNLHALASYARAWND
jgi:DNA-binding MarR family transcriptional regulator